MVAYAATSSRSCVVCTHIQHPQRSALAIAKYLVLEPRPFQRHHQQRQHLVSKQCLRHTPMPKRVMHSLARSPSVNEASTIMPGLLSLAPHQHVLFLRHHRQYLQQANRCSVASSTTAPSRTILLTYDEPCFRCGRSFLALTSRRPMRQCRVLHLRHCSTKRGICMKSQPPDEHESPGIRILYAIDFGQLRLRRQPYRDLRRDSKTVTSIAC